MAFTKKKKTFEILAPITFLMPPSMQWRLHVICDALSHGLEIKQPDSKHAGEFQQLCMKTSMIFTSFPGFHYELKMLLGWLRNYLNFKQHVTLVENGP